MRETTSSCTSGAEALNSDGDMLRSFDSVGASREDGILEKEVRDRHSFGGGNVLDGHVGLAGGNAHDRAGNEESLIGVNLGIGFCEGSDGNAETRRYFIEGCGRRRDDQT